jgi:ubiquitin-protein ligase
VPMNYTGGGVGGGGTAMLPPALPFKVQQELTSLTAGRERGIKVVPQPDRPTHHLVVYLTDPAQQQPTEMVSVDVQLPDDYPRSPPRVQLPPGRAAADARIVDAAGTVSAPALLSKEWGGIYGENYGNQLIEVLRHLHRLLFEAPSPASAPPAEAGGGGAPHGLGGGGAGGGTGAAPAAQAAQPLSGGKPFRISNCRGKSRQYGGFMVGRALGQLRAVPQTDGRDWRHTVSSESLAAACRAIGEEGPNSPDQETKGFRVWNLTDAEVIISWEGGTDRKSLPRYDPHDPQDPRRLVRTMPALPLALAVQNSQLTESMRMLDRTCKSPNGVILQ